MVVLENLPVEGPVPETWNSAGTNYIGEKWYFGIYSITANRFRHKTFFEIFRIREKPFRKTRRSRSIQ